MGKLITNKTIQILVLQALIAVLLAVCNPRASHAAPYTIFGFDDPRGTLTNSNAARDAFNSSVFDANVNNLESYTVGERNAIFAESLPVVLGNRDVQFGLTFTLGGNTIYARSSRVTESYATGLVLTGTTTPQYDDQIVNSSTISGFNATPVSGTKFMGGESKNLRFDFATTANTGNATGVNAFGFYGIDAGDTALNNLSVDVTYVDNTTQNFAIKPGGF